MAKASLLRHPKDNATLCLTTDASDVAVGAVVEQKCNGEREPLGFFSRKLDRTQARYSVHDRKLLAIYKSIKFFKHFIEVRDLVLRTDHKPLIHAFNQKSENISLRQVRHLDYIGQFTNKIFHITGTDNIIADVLSRIETINIPALVSTDDLLKEQTADTELKEIIANPDNKFKLERIQINGTNLYLYCDIIGNNIRPYIAQTIQKKKI